MTEESTHQEDITIQNMNEVNNRALKYMSKNGQNYEDRQIHNHRQRF